MVVCDDTSREGGWMFSNQPAQDPSWEAIDLLKLVFARLTCYRGPMLLLVVGA